MRHHDAPVICLPRLSTSVFPHADSPQVQRHLTLYHGVIPLMLTFTDSAEVTFDAAMSELVARGYLTQGQIVALVQSGKKPIWRSASTHTIQVTHCATVLLKLISAGRQLFAGCSSEAAGRHHPLV